MEVENSELAIELNKLDNINHVLLDLSISSIKKYGLYVFDLYCAAIVNRTLNLNKGFSAQIMSENFISAAPLVRISLDSLLRLFAAFQVGYNINTFANDVIQGKPINKIKDRHGSLMKDYYLVNLLSSRKRYGWVKKIYKDGNEYVHFTSQHIFASIVADNVDNKETIEGIMKFGDSYINLNEKIWATKAMVRITEGIIEFLDIWIQHKSNINKNLKS